MSYLEKLLEGLEVEFKPLGELSEIIRGVRITKKELLTNGKYPVVSGGTGYMGYTNQYNREENTTTIAQYGTAGYVKWQTEKFWANDICYSLKPNIEIINNRYLYFHLISKQQYLYEISNRSAIPYSIERDKILNIQIPIPCPHNPKKSLEIQNKIVRILDNFTELTARKKQYTFYLEQLFYFDEVQVKHLPMGNENIGKFIRGGGLQKKDFTETGVGCIHYGQIYTYYGTYTDKTKTFVSVEFAKKARMAKYGDLVIATTSETDDDVCKAVAWLGDEEIAVSSDACFYTHCLNPKYVAYFFLTEQFQKQKRPYITGTKVRRVNADDIAKIKIPVPSPEEQERIVSILDKFDTLTTSISEGLPKEIELRKKQYEYYRDLLLTFPHNETV
jgi:type I restriction enzyme S subunit